MDKTQYELQHDKINNLAEKLTKNLKIFFQNLGNKLLDNDILKISIFSNNIENLKYNDILQPSKTSNLKKIFEVKSGWSFSWFNSKITKTMLTNISFYDFTILNFYEKTFFYLSILHFFKKINSNSNQYTYEESKTIIDQINALSQFLSIFSSLLKKITNFCTLTKKIQEKEKEMDSTKIKKKTKFWEDLDTQLENVPNIITQIQLYIIINDLTLHKEINFFNKIEVGYILKKILQKKYENVIYPQIISDEKQKYFIIKKSDDSFFIIVKLYEEDEEDEEEKKDENIINDKIEAAKKEQKEEEQKEQEEKKEKKDNIKKILNVYKNIFTKLGKTITEYNDDGALDKVINAIDKNDKTKKKFIVFLSNIKKMNNDDYDVLNDVSNTYYKDYMVYFPYLVDYTYVSNKTKLTMPNLNDGGVYNEYESKISQIYNFLEKSNMNIISNLHLLSLYCGKNKSYYDKLANKIIDKNKKPLNLNDETLINEENYNNYKYITGESLAFDKFKENEFNILKLINFVSNSKNMVEIYAKETSSNDDLVKLYIFKYIIPGFKKLPKYPNLEYLKEYFTKKVGNKIEVSTIIYLITIYANSRKK